MRKYIGLLTVFKKVYIYILARRNVGISKFEEKLRPSIETKQCQNVVSSFYQLIGETNRPTQIRVK